MDNRAVIDHRVFLAFGAVAVGIFFALRMNPAAIKEVSLLAIGTSHERTNVDAYIC